MSIEAPVLPFVQQESSRFSPSELAQLDLTRIPRHIAIIPDGNRRWAKKHRSNPSEGHREGADILMDIVKGAKELGVKAITFYSFSTENWNRSREEVTALMALFTSYLIRQREEMLQHGVRLQTIGDLHPLPSFLNQAIRDTKEATSSCDKIDLILALNYGSRNEMCRAFKTMLEDYDQHAFTKEALNEELISRYLDTSPWRDPDLLIRTSGEFRISNFLLWQISYTEIHVTPVLWPDFTLQHLLEAIMDYQSRDRRWGGA